MIRGTMLRGITLWWVAGVLIGLSLGRSRRRFLIWGCAGVAILGALAMSLVAIRLVIVTQREFSDPCFQWGVASVHYYTSPESPRGRDGRNPCTNGFSATSETRSRAAWRLISLAGGTLLATWLGLSGLFRRSFALTLCGTVLMFIVFAQLVMSIMMPVAWLTGVGLLAAASHSRCHQHPGNLHAGQSEGH